MYTPQQPPFSPERTVLQVFSFGHPLQSKSEKYLRWKSRQLGGVAKTYYVHLHIDRFDRTIDAVKAAFEDLKAQGADLTGRTRTLLVPPGSSTAAMVLSGAWAGLTGQLPVIFNIIRLGDQGYGPSPEKPELDMVEFVELEAQSDVVISLPSVRNHCRPLRSEMIQPASIGVRTI